MHKKTVIIIGVLDNPTSTNVSQAKAFINKGFNVIPINYRTLMSEYGIKTFEKIVLDTVEKYSPYLVLFCKCNGINPDLVSECSKKTITWLWNPDVINEKIPRYPEVIQHAVRADFSSGTSLDIVRYFKEHGAKNCYHIFDGLDADVFKPVEPVEEFKCDISFIGTKLDHRDQIKDILEQSGYDVKFYGHGYIGEVYNKEFAQVCCSSKYVLSINSLCGEDLFFSNRLLRLMGCKRCVFHWDPFYVLKDMFIDGKEIILFRSAEELITKLKFLNNHEEIAENGYIKVINNYTWEHSVDHILRIIENA